MMRPIIAVICSLFVAISVFAQGGIPLKTGQKYVTAIVDPGSGWVQVKIFPGKPYDGTLSYPQKSFVSFDVNGKVFTNNDVGLGVLPANTFILKDGVLTKRKGTRSNTDTIVCTWPNKEGVDLIQEIYPVLLEKSEQIVFRWKAVNKTTSNVIVAVQYLLDVQVGIDNIVNDGSPILTRYGYRPNWDMFTTGIGTGVPPFYLSPQNKLPNSPTFDPGITGTGYTDNVYVNLGLTKPYRQTIGDWNKLIEVRWGPPTPLPNGQYTDAATLFEFNGATAIPNKETPLAATSYGTGEFATCRGQLFGMIMYPLRLKWEPPNLSPNPFTIDFFAFNPQQIGAATNSTLTLSVGDQLTIIDPLPTFNNGKSQTQALGVGGVIPALGVGAVSWKVQAATSDTCQQDIISSLKFFAVSPNLGYPIFVNDATGTDTCEHAILIECSNPNRDTLPPIHDPIIVNVNGDKRMLVHDDRSKDTGLKSITWKAVGNTDTSNFVVTVTPDILPCSKNMHSISIHQIDTSKSGCFDITFEDCLGNTSDTVVCFNAKYPPYIPDTIAPMIFDKITVSNKIGTFIMTDTTVIDTGISQLTVLPPVYGTASAAIDPPLVPCSKLVHQVYLSRKDSLHSECIKYAVTDCAGNMTIDSICFVGTLAVKSNPDERIFSILGNPSSGKATILLTLESAQDITLRIVDPLGREVRRLDINGLSQGENLIPLQTNEFASGTYYVIVEIDGKEFAKSLKVLR